MNVLRLALVTFVMALPLNSAAGDLENGKDLLFNAPNRFEYGKAIEFLEKAVAAEPERAEARLLLVWAYSKTFRAADAPVHVAVAQTHREQLSSHDALWLDALAEWAADTDSVVDAWKAVVAEYPEDRWAWYELAAAHATVDEQAMAAKAAARAAEIEPDASRWEASWLYYLHSKSLYRSGQYEAAVAAAEPGRNNPTTWRSTSYRQSLAKIKAGDLPQADIDKIVSDYREVSAAEGRNNAAFTEVNIALFYFELGDYERATSTAETAREMEDSSYAAWALGFSLAENGNAIEALDVLESSLATREGDSLLQTAYGWALYRAGRLEEALQQLLIVRSASPRRQHFVETRIAVVERAIADPDAPSAPPVPWLG